MSSAFCRYAIPMAAAWALGAPAFGAASSNQADFLKEVHAINQAEIDAGTMAETRGQSQAIKDYGKTLAADHRAADDKVEAVAKANGVDLATTQNDDAVNDLKSKLNRMSTDLQKDSPQDFDHDFAKRMVDGHEDAIKLVQNAKSKFSDAKDIHGLATGLLPQLEKHKEMAQALEKTGTAH